VSLDDRLRRRQVTADPLLFGLQFVDAHRIREVGFFDLLAPPPELVDATSR
jgi:hypothetical protein